MDSTTYVHLNRQRGLQKKLDVIAQNIANMNTNGYQKEAVVFSEYIRSLDNPVGMRDSISMGTARTRYMNTAQGDLVQTGSPLDFALEGGGYFMIETPRGNRLSLNGHFARNEAGELVTPDGMRLLDIGGAPVFIPPQAQNTSVGMDGTISADGEIIGRIGIFSADPKRLVREGDNLLRPLDAPTPIEDTKLLQGFLTSSNVTPIDEMSDMIAVQRAYEAGRNMMQTEHERIERVIQTLGRPV